MVDRFYNLIDADTAYSELRAMHAADLSPMRTSLTGFLVAWLGGPRDWFEDNPGKCMMSAHRGVRFTASSSHQWAEAMTRAVQGGLPDSDLAEQMAQALGSMALRMGGVSEGEG